MNIKSKNQEAAVSTAWSKLLALGFAGMLLPAVASGVEYDLTLSGDNSLNVTGDVGGTALFANYFAQPTGTGVFDPFLSLQGKGSAKTEQAYNTDGFTALYMDSTRPNWNNLLKVGDLAKTTIDGVSYYTFVLDANEPGGDKSLISIDNIRVYTSGSDNTGTVQSDVTKLDSLGTLRWAMNDPTQNPDGSYNIDDWVKLDANQQNVDKVSNGGSGIADMVVYIPVLSFGGAADTDFVWFYNLNGVHYTADSGLAAESGYEEWKALTDPTRIPDSSSTLVLLGAALASLAFATRRQIRF